MKPKQKELVARFVAALEAYNENERRKMLASEQIAALLKKNQGD